MSLVTADRIRGAAKARPFRKGYEPSWLRKMSADYVNADKTSVAETARDLDQAHPLESPDTQRTIKPWPVARLASTGGD
jgi:hypothetical protein